MSNAYRHGADEVIGQLPANMAPRARKIPSLRSMSSPTMRRAAPTHRHPARPCRSSLPVSPPALTRLERDFAIHDDRTDGHRGPGALATPHPWPAAAGFVHRSRRIRESGRRIGPLGDQVRVHRVQHVALPGHRIGRDPAAQRVTGAAGRRRLRRDGHPRRSRTSGWPASRCAWRSPRVSWCRTSRPPGSRWRPPQGGRRQDRDRRLRDRV